MSSTVGVAVDETPYDDPRVQRLVESVQAEYVTRYGSPDESPMEAEKFLPPHGRFFVAMAGDEPVAMGGWRLRPELAQIVDLGGSSGPHGADSRGDQRVAEIKRMYVAPTARRTGLARLVLRRLEESARADGCDLLVLETGLKQPEAIQLYESAGYVPVTPFGIYKDSPLSRYYGRRLVD